MENIQKIGNECVGCGSCMQVCPYHCISLKSNEEGFIYPLIDRDKCVACGVCLNHCPVTFYRPKEEIEKNFYGLKNKNKERLMNSASGGASDVFANWIIEQCGIVYGCAYDENLKVKHIEISRKEDLWKIQSSKYVQSEIGNCYKMAKENLEKGKLVLFTGTPCQIAGLYAFLGNHLFDNLLTIDLICHGVPSPKFFEKYLQNLESKIGEKILSYNFRSKEKNGWGKNYKYMTKSKIKIGILDLDKYGSHFMNGDCFRESCYKCKYANLNRVADISVGDFWGILKCNPSFFSEEGVSSVIVNSIKGKELVSEIKEKVDWIQVEEKDILIKQGNLQHPVNRLQLRDTFYKNIDYDNYMNNIRVGICLKERIKAIVPKAIVLKLKKIT